MKYSRLTDRLITEAPEPGNEAIDPWAIHTLALERIDQGEAITLLSIGQEADEQTPEPVVNAAVQSLKQGRHHYSDVRGHLKLRQAIARYHTRLTGQAVSSDHITVFLGAQNALFSLAQVLLQSDDEVILVAPYYTTYAATFGAPGPDLVIVQVNPADGYQVDVSELLDSVTERTQVIVLNAPNNPLGSRYSSEQLQQIVDVCVKRDIWLILDAVYLDIVEPDSIALPHHLPGAAERLITVGSLSKSHRMTGWRIGWSVGPTALNQHLHNLSVCMHYGLPPFIMDAAVHAIEHSANTPETVKQAMQLRRQLAVDALADCAPVKLIDPGQGMFLLLEVEPLSMTAYEFASQLLEHSKVSVLPCDGFGPGGHFLVRIGLCVDGERLAEACTRIRQFIRHRAVAAGN